MKTINRSTASLFPTSTITTVPLAIISLLLFNGRFRRIRSLLSVSLFAIGLVAIAVTPALAGSGGFSGTGSMNVARVDHTATLLANGEVLATGGAAGLSSAELYNPATGKWTFTGSMRTGRWNHRAVRLPDGQVLAAGGIDASGNTSASAELYTPSTGTWNPTGNMGVAREDFTLTLLANGKVLAAGGAGGRVQR
jgi:galactose oxidase-like protein